MLLLLVPRLLLPRAILISVLVISPLIYFYAVLKATLMFQVLKLCLFLVLEVELFENQDILINLGVDEAVSLCVLR